MDTLREHCRRIGMIRSAAKSKAARENGKLGGRPRKAMKEPNVQGSATIGRTVSQTSATY